MLASLPPIDLTDWPAIVSAVVVVLALFYSPGGFHSRRKHRYKLRQARKVLDRLADIEAPGQKLTYLRKIDPFTFEELLLEAYRRKGHKIKRNLRYTGDGGIDGRVWIDGDLHLVQAKRYKSHVSAAHVSAFLGQVQAARCKGLFIHTGRTGRKSKEHASHQDVDIISGQRLLDLIAAPSAKRSF